VAKLGVLICHLVIPLLLARVFLAVGLCPFGLYMMQSLKPEGFQNAAPEYSR